LLLRELLLPVARLAVPQAWPHPPAQDAHATMRASVFDRGGDARSVLKESRVPRPVPRPHQILVQVVFAGGNPVDFKFRQDPIWPICPLPKISGFDFAGVVVEAAAASGAAGFRPGDRVHGMLPCPLHEWGTFAEYVAVDEAYVARMPAGMSFQEAAGMPLAALTAMQAVEQAGENRGSGVRVLVHAGAGGVGTFLIQLAKASGWEVWTTCSAGCELCRSLGADRIVDYKREQFDVVAGGEAFDVVFDLMGGDYLLRSVPLCKRRGVYVEILNSGWQTYFGAKSPLVPSVALSLWASMAYYTIRGLLGLGPRYTLVAVRPDGAMLAELDRLFVDGKLKVVIDRQMSGLDEGARQLHEYLETNTAKGKVVLAVQ